MIATYKILSTAMCYPTAEFQAVTEGLIEALEAENLLPASQTKALAILLREIGTFDLLETQSRYVDLFDRTRSLSLHLFEHVHGESRDRGQAMVSLLERYREAGLDLSANELPDYIPLFLEFLSTLQPKEARAMLADTNHILSALGERLRKRQSAYAAIMEALVTLSHSTPDADALAALTETHVENPNDTRAIDQAWEESEVRFGPDDSNDSGCPRATEIVQRMEAYLPDQTSGARK
ncbi:MAG: nitrate reductase molybdenum cofactor assembly chaperone [Rhodospirillaceae bacterium]|nr:nitrate reductase molybdenum cofactor assembly chaperone [Rhodospirillaceae bacterium]